MRQQNMVSVLPSKGGNSLVWPEFIYILPALKLQVRVVSLGGLLPGPSAVLQWRHVDKAAFTQGPFLNLSLIHHSYYMCVLHYCDSEIIYLKSKTESLTGPPLSQLVQSPNYAVKFCSQIISIFIDLGLMVLLSHGRKGDSLSMEYGFIIFLWFCQTYM